MASQPTDKVEGVGDDFVGDGQDKTPIKPKRTQIVVSADTPTVKVNAGIEQFCAPWTAQSPGGTVTTSAYNEDGKKRCLSAEGGSGDTRKKVLEQNKTFKRADRNSGGLALEEIRAEAHKRQKKMGDAARAAEMTKEELALEKRKGLAEKAAARRAASGQAGKDKHAAGEAERWAASGQAGKDKHAGVEATRRAASGQAGKGKHAAGEAARKAASGQAGTVKRAAEEAARWAASGQAGKDKHAGVEAKRKASSGQAGTVKRAAEEAARWAASGQAGKDKHAGVEATRRAASGQAGKDKHAAGEAERWAASGQADKGKHAGVEAARKAATGQAGRAKRAAGDATRWAKKKAAAATALEEAAAKQRQSRQEQRELYAQLTRQTHETHGKAWCAAEDRKLKDSYFPGVNAHISLCALASFALAPPPA